MKKTKKPAQPTPTAAAGSQPNREEIEAIAYLVWKQAGCPDGNHEAHWLQAEAQLGKSKSTNG
jgi:hypothetical protein